MAVVTLRLINAMCDKHRDRILSTQIWTPGFNIGDRTDCRACAEVSDSLPRQMVYAVVPGTDGYEVGAFHEAGHVVVHLLHGVESLEVEMDDDRGKGGGRVSFTAQQGWLGGTDYLAGTWAGFAASIHLIERSGLLDDAAVVDMARRAGSDMEQALGYEPDLRRHCEARERATVLVDEHWSSVERVADALLARGRLTGAEIAELAGCGVS